ncbi:MAG: hypothetical protein ABIH89_06565 [Elusimicrobiota bacterium]
MPKKIDLEINDELFENITEKAKAMGYSGPEQFLISLLSEVAKEGHSDRYSPEEEEKIKKRLKDLGYI